MIVNRKEIAKRINLRTGYQIGQIEEVLKALEDISVEALENGEDVKLGKLFKIFLQEVPYKRAYDGLNKEYFDREAKRVPKLQPLKRLEDIELPPKGK